MAVSLQEDRPVLDGVVLEKIRPGRETGETAPDRQAGLRLRHMDDVGVSPERLRPGIVPQVKVIAVLPVEFEPARIDKFDTRELQAFPLAFPEHLADRKALSERIHHVDQAGPHGR